MMIKPFPSCPLNMDFFFSDFTRRFLSLLQSDFLNIDVSVALDLVEANLSSKTNLKGEFIKQDLSKFFSLYEL